MKLTVAYWLRTAADYLNPPAPAPAPIRTTGQPRLSGRVPQVPRVPRLT
ncbi:hypothetical protein ACWEQ4_01210 [Rhodococcus sp. NPDC003994]